MDDAIGILCCYVPNFLIASACCDQPGWTERPLALLGADERVVAVSAAARRSGVQIAVRAQAARLACPDLHLQPLNIQASQARQTAYLAALGEWELPVESQGWGLAYIDLNGIAHSTAAVQPLAADLGRRLRRTLGAALQPALGWDSSKFTARAAAMWAAPGRMKLVEQADVARFLAGQPISLLPLSPPHLQQLQWLGIHTLGQFAQLPATAVWQRFGAAGKLAQQWARGKDNRPVCGAAATTYPPVTVDIDPPTASLQPVMANLLASLQPLLRTQQGRMEGIRRLHLAYCFANGAESGSVLDFVYPVNQPARIEAALMQQLGAQPWPGALTSVRWTLLATGEVVVAQLSLFAAPASRVASLGDLARPLAERYGAVFFQAQQSNASHPLPERRSRFVDVPSLA